MDCIMLGWFNDKDKITPGDKDATVREMNEIINERLNC